MPGALEARPVRRLIPPLPAHSPSVAAGALLALEACKVQQYPFQEGQAVEAMDWEMYISEIANDILGEQNPKVRAHEGHLRPRDPLFSP